MFVLRQRNETHKDFVKTNHTLSTASNFLICAVPVKGTKMKWRKDGLIFFHYLEFFIPSTKKTRAMWC